MRCNLRCKLCSVQAPYYSKPYHPTLDMLYKEADRFFKVVYSVERFIVSGGEVMMRSDLHEWVTYLSQYADRIGRLELNSNGTIMPSEKLLSSLSAYPGPLRLLVDNYGHEISRNAEAITGIFRSLGKADVELRDYYTENAHFGGWVDYGVYDIEKLHRKNREDTIKSWTTCSSHRSRYFMTMLDGKIYHCARQIWLVNNGIIPAVSDEVVDFFDDSQTDDDIRAKISFLYKRIAFTTCEFCNGLHEDAPRFTPAEQLTYEEQKNYWRVCNEHGEQV
nr:radical SAM protein [Desulfitobacterium hafniense]